MENKKAPGIVRTHVAWATGAGLIPVPIVDFVAVTAIQLDMLRELAAAYNKDFSEASGKSWLSALGGTYLARLGAQAIKTIPGIGSIIGGVSMGVLSGATTFAIGQVFIRHFESGGDFFDFDAEQFKDFFDEQFEQGKTVAKEMQKKKNTKAETTTDFDPIKRLKKIQAMRESGILTEAEFEELKQKILAQI
ncbi:MAG: DUF697 domain-containing protein [Bernardetiaceae bacterium]